MDIDIDLPTTFDASKVFPDAVIASMVKNRELKKHPCGYYFQDIAKDEITQLAAIPYEQAEELGYFKIDFLHLSLLDYFKSKKEIRILLSAEPNWSLLEKEQHVQKLFQIHRHHALLIKIKPQNVQELADCIALIRPGKKHLVDQYIRNKIAVRKQLYSQSENGYTFRKSHAIAYALTITLQLHLIAYGIL